MILQHLLIWAAGYGALHGVEHSALLATPRHVVRGGIIGLVIAAVRFLYVA